MDLGNLPRQVRYDFFMTLLGVVIMLYSGYVWINSLSGDPDVTIIFFMIVGYGIFLLGLIDLREDFAMEYNLKRLSYEERKTELVDKLKSMDVPLKRIYLKKIRYNSFK